jgi:plasmanylethanolamine desaturase
MVMTFCGSYLLFKYDAWPLIIGDVILGYFASDFASGLVHWGMDTWFSERVFGRAVAIAQEHHIYPQAILGYEDSALGSASSAFFVGSASVVTALFPASATRFSFMVVWFITSTCLFFGTSFHNFAHRRSKSPLIRLAQKLHLVITPEHHWMHHRSDQIIRYCVINGWANHVCDPARIWRGLEWLVSALTGAEPRRDDLEWQRRFSENGMLTRSHGLPAQKWQEPKS